MMVKELERFIGLEFITDETEAVPMCHAVLLYSYIILDVLYLPI